VYLYFCAQKSVLQISGLMPLLEDWGGEVRENGSVMNRGVATCDVFLVVCKFVKW